MTKFTGSVTARDDTAEIAALIRPFDDVHFDFPETHVLPNGIPVQVINQGADDVNKLSVYVRGGILDEDVSMLSMLTAAAAVEGSERYTSSQIANRLDFNGAWKATQSYDDWTEISFWSLNEHYDVTLDILLDCLTLPRFDADDFALLQRRYASTYALQHGRGKYLAALALREMLYGVHHPLSRDTLPEGIMAITPSQAHDFFSRFYKPQGMRIVLAGRISDEIMKATEATMGRLNLEGEVPPCYSWAQFSFPETARQRIVDMPDAVQASVAIAIPAIPRRHPDYIKLRVLVTLLGGYFGSRLMANIREEKGYTYGISAVLAGREHSGYIGISTECDIAATMPLIGEVKLEMKRLREELVTSEELDIVKQSMISELVKTFDTPFNMASYVASTITFGVYPEYFNDQVAQITAITPEQLMLMAQRYLLEDRMLTAIAAPRDAIIN